MKKFGKGRGYGWGLRKIFILIKDVGEGCGRVLEWGKMIYGMDCVKGLCGVCLVKVIGVDR